jgi:DNA-binding GntR family transcriptional regulator
MKSPIRKSVPGKDAEAKSRKIKPASGRTARGDQRGLHAVGRASTHQRRGESLGDFAYRTMRKAIRSGKFRSGEHLREADIAKWLNISRTPVREAFHRIVSEGLLTNGPWNGVMVADLDAQQLVQLYAVRAALEGTAAALAAQHASEAEIQGLFHIAASEARAKKNPEKLVILNSELHQALYAAAHNRYLLQSITTVVDALGLLRHSTFVLPGSIELAHREHLQIITAVRDRNAAEAERLARRHVNHALAMRLELQRLRTGVA